ncbi:hypothetical protein PHSY_005502 [Pseudozyma hubeiensis SY62]|uniref:Uncharacterized protein n=1 Tax=Pseudozyma hubeiensis (strain SY62) TaxID=1305764 RepID=R9P996_PSEHS|nr:hypothetical protein PHSY_005502 [Pseudozyma hubeiensis SY62]GAC97914.1 hypothetical protein PHSY_005502 [Pseudozyma hubeiensis SY62]
MIAPVGASLVANGGPASSRDVTHQFSLAQDTVATIRPFSNSNIPSDVQLLDSLHAQRPPQPVAQPASSRQATLLSQHDHASSSMDAIDDQLPEHLHASSLHQQYARQIDDEPNLFVERDALQPSTDSSAVSTRSLSKVTHSGQRYSLPSSYPSSIASSWSRPERSVWFQQKAIIITSIFLAIFIVLFIGAAVFLRERKFDDELEGLDDEEALARIEERMTMGRFSDPAEKDDGNVGDGKSRRRFRLGRKRSEKDGSDPDLSQPSSGSSSAVKRKRHLVSRWTRGNLRNSDDTMRGVSDTASIRSGRSARRVALGNVRTGEETVEITYDDDGAEAQRTVDNNGGPESERPRSPPPPHPDNENASASSPSGGRSTSAVERHGGDASGVEESRRSPRRVLLDDSDFQAADAAETHHPEGTQYMPPAYIPSGSGGASGSAYDGAAVANAIALGDAKHGIPSPAERDPTISPEVISAALAHGRPSASQDEHEPSGPVAGHVATDDKAVLGALSAAASMPSAPAVDGGTSAPAYVASHASGVGSSAAAAGPSAPDMEVDGDGFEIAPAEEVDVDATRLRSLETEAQAGKGKAKQAQTSSMLPAPPSAVEPAFSPFDQPYRSAGPPGARSPSSLPGRRSTDDPNALMSQRKSEKQKEAEQEQQLAQLVASRPDATDVPTYERMESAASAPPLAEDDSVVSGSVADAAEHLPAYAQRRKSTTAPAATAPSHDASAPSAPSAPPMHDQDEE